MNAFAAPGTIPVRKGDGPMTVTCKKEGYLDVTISVEEVIADATLGNILIGGGIGIIIDAVSGTAQRYPDQIIVWMEPEEWGYEEERLKWLKEKKIYQAKLAVKQKAQQETTQAPFGN